MFDHDQKLSAHLRGLQPNKPPQRQSSKGNEETMTTGTVAHILRDGSVFVIPDGVSSSDRAKHLFAHRLALARAGLADIAVGAKIEFSVKPAPRSGMKDEAADIKLISANAVR
jgi:cold shock CspA family protein